MVGKTTDHVDAVDAAEHIFGYVNFMDVSAREIKSQRQQQLLLAEVVGHLRPHRAGHRDPRRDRRRSDLRIQLWINGEIRQDLSTSDMGRTCEEVLEFASWITTLKAGDVVSTGTNHVGLSPIQDGDVIDMEIEGLGRLTVDVKDNWKRTWPRKTLSQMTAFESSVRSKRK